MRERLVKLTQSVDRLSLRERLLLLAAGLFVVGGLWEAALAAPLAARERLANDKVTALQDRLSELDVALSAAAVGISEGMPDQLERVHALRESVRVRGEEMRVFTSDLVDPTQMRLVLEELLRRQDGLELVSAVNRPARTVLDDEDAAEEPSGTAAAESDADAEEIRARDAHSRERGVNGVPTFVIANQHVVTGAQPAELWSQVIDDIMAQISAQAE
jgi:hypothetical protein